MAKTLVTGGTGFVGLHVDEAEGGVACRVGLVALAHVLERPAMVVAQPQGRSDRLTGLPAETTEALLEVALLAEPSAEHLAPGGKVGLDRPHGRNLVGLFKQPTAVVAEPVEDLLHCVQYRCGAGQLPQPGGGDHQLLGEERVALDDVVGHHDGVTGRVRR